MSIYKFLSCLLFSVVLTACGGGGGSKAANETPVTSQPSAQSSVTGQSSAQSSVASSSSISNVNGDFVIDTSTLDFSFYAGLGDVVSPLSISGTVKNATGTVYINVDTSKTNLVKGASLTPTDKGADLNVYPIEPSSMSLGTTSGIIYIHACKDAACTKEYSGSPKTVTVNYTLRATDFSLSTDTVNFRMTANQILPSPQAILLQSSYLIMSHGGTFSSDGANWLHLDEFIQLSDTKGTLSISVAKKLAPGTYSSELSYYINTSAVTKKIKVNLIVDPESINVVGDDLKFIIDGTNVDATSRSLTISGTANSNWTLTLDDNWVDASTKTGTSTSSTPLKISLNSAAFLLSPGLHQTQLHFKDDKNNSVDRTLNLFVNAGGYGVKSNNSFDLGAGVYSYQVNKLNSYLYISDMNSFLYFVNLKTGKVDDFISLPISGSTMTITPDASQLIIGGSFSSGSTSGNQIVRVDTKTKNILNYFSVDAAPFSLAATNEGKLFASWNIHSWVSVDRFDMATGAKVGSVNNIYGRSTLRIHPNGKWLFSVDTSLSPTSLNIFDFSGPGLSYREGSTGLSGWSDLGRDLCFSADGSLLVTSAGAVLKTDLTLAHQTQKLAAFTSYDYLPAKNQLVLLRSAAYLGSVVMNFYDASTLAPISNQTDITSDADFLFVSENLVYQLKAANKLATISKY